MDDSMLSQEEINALLNGDSLGDGAGEKDAGERLTDAEKDAVGEISNISMGTAATTLSTLVNKKVVITTPVVSYGSWDDIVNSNDRPCVFIQISYREGLNGKNVLILKEADVKVITDLMMGGDGSNTADELSELHLSAISEAMNQMMGSASTSISSMLEKKVDISPPTASLVNLNDTIKQDELDTFMQDDFVIVSFKMQIEGLVDSELMQLYPFDFAKNLYNKFVENSAGGQEAPPQPEPAPQPAVPQQPQPQQMQQQAAAPPQQQMAMPTMGAMPMQGGMAMPYGMPMQDLNVQPVQFQTFSNNVTPLNQQENIELIMDVPLEVTVELGRTNKSIKEILDFTPGTIVELNRLAGEPVDVLVNGKFVAKGEVVVIEESFGVRVTEIIK